MRRAHNALLSLMALLLLLCAPSGAHAKMDAPYQGVSMTRLSLRAAPSSEAEALSYFNEGDTVYVLEYDLAWLRVQKNEIIGFVPRHLVKVTKQLDPDAPKYGTLFVRHVASLKHEAPLYESPDVNSATLANLPKDARVAILSLQDGWAKLIYNRQFGYIHASHLLDLEPVAKDPVAARGDALLAAYHTPYGTSQTELNRGRMVNIEMACAYMEDYIIEPGQTLSYNQWVGPFSAGRGFQQAPVLINGQVLPGSGGGTCQVSTTLYNAMVALPGITILYVRPHGASGAAYVPHGMDAAVGAEKIDLVFRNDYPFPLKVKTWAGDGIVYTALYKAAQ